jgi:hypothetical protein
VNNTLPLFNSTNLPNRVSSSVHSSGGFNLATDLYLNVSAFSVPAPFTFGNAPVTLSARGCPLFNENLGLMKRTPINERVNIELRFEFFNVFNRHVFAAPSANVSSPFSFGKIGGKANSLRQGQIAIKINF